MALTVDDALALSLVGRCSAAGALTFSASAHALLTERSYPLTFLRGTISTVDLPGVVLRIVDADADEASADDDGVISLSAPPSAEPRDVAVLSAIVIHRYLAGNTIGSHAEFRGLMAFVDARDGADALVSAARGAPVPLRFAVPALLRPLALGRAGPLVAATVIHTRDLLNPVVRDTPQEPLEACVRVLSKIGPAFAIDIDKAQTLPHAFTLDSQDRAAWNALVARRRCARIANMYAQTVDVKAAPASEEELAATFAPEARVEGPHSHDEGEAEPGEEKIARYKTMLEDASERDVARCGAAIAAAAVDAARGTSAAGPVTVVDIGCGTGFIPLELARCLQQSVPEAQPWHIIGTDVVYAFAEMSAQRARESLPFLDGKLHSVDIITHRPESIVMIASGIADSVLIVDVFHHFEFPRTMMQEVRRVLKPGAKLLILEPNPGEPGGDEKYVHPAFRKHAGDGGSHGHSHGGHGHGGHGHSHGGHGHSHGGHGHSHGGGGHGHSHSVPAAPPNTNVDESMRGHGYHFGAMAEVRDRVVALGFEFVRKVEIEGVFQNFALLFTSPGPAVV